MKKRFVTIIMGLAVAAVFAQDDDLLPVALGPVTAIKPLQQKAEADGKADLLEILTRGLETALTAELSDSDSPFALIGGNVGANLYKKIVIDQKSPTETDGEDEVRYGLSVEITAFTDAQTPPAKSGGLIVAQREIVVMASALMHDVGRMRAAIAVPSVTAVGKRLYRVNSESELLGIAAQSEILVGEAQKDLAKKLATGLLEAYHKFPAYVVKVDGDEVTIDQGAAWCKVGDVLTLYGPPTEIEKTTRGRVKKTKTVMVPGKKLGTMTVTDVFGSLSRCKFTGEGAESDGVVYK